MIPIFHLHALGTAELLDAGAGLRPAVLQPKRFAVLAYLALARPRGFQRRDILIALFWPELDQERGRAALRKAVHYLRRSLGAGIIAGHGDEELAIAPGALWCDAVAFEQAIEAGRLDEAVELYRGDLLPGFFISDAPEFEKWMDGERARLRRRAAEAAAALAAEAEQGGSPAAAEWARRAVEIAPDDEVLMRGLISLLDRTGDRAGALAAYEAFSQRMDAEYGLPPARETQALVQAIRAGASPERGGAEPAARLDEPSTPPSAAPGRREADGPGPERPRDAAGTGQPSGPRPPHGRRRWAGGITAAVAALALAGLCWSGTRPRPAPSPLVLAVGEIRNLSGDAALGGSVPDLLSTNLSRAPQLQVVSAARIREIVSGRPAGRPNADVLAAAARRAGATEIVEGTLRRQPDGRLRLDLRRVALADGRVRGSYAAAHGDAFGLVDKATSAILRDTPGFAGGLAVADVTTRSLLAYRLYQDGVRAYYRGERAAAAGLLASALREDSAFAMAAYYAALNHDDVAVSRPHLARAARHAARASDRERLLIKATWADAMNDPSRLAVAETLAARYPADPDGHYLLGYARVWGGDFLGAVPYLRHAIRLDSALGGAEQPRCRACDAARFLVLAYTMADSLGAAEREAREFARRMPHSVVPLDALANTLEGQGRLDEALAIRRRMIALEPSYRPGLLLPAHFALRGGDFDRADRLLRAQAEAGTQAERREALWLLVISLRHQGRLREALSAAREFRGPPGGALPPGDPAIYGALPEAVVLFEMGRGRQAAALFQAISRRRLDEAPGWVARDRAWMLTHLATALHSAGDTARLAALADSIERYGRESAFGRDPRLHHHVRGLLWSARGRPAEAAAAFRRAVFSLPQGYSRTNLELARALAGLGRHREAISVLRPVIRGPLQASSLYLTRTEVDEALGAAYERAGEPDSALSHYRRAIQAWSRADPEFRPRTEHMRRRLAALRPSLAGTAASPGAARGGTLQGRSRTSDTMERT